MKPQFLLFLLLLAPISSAQTPADITAEPHHHLLLENEKVRVFSVALPPSERAFVQHEHNFLAVTLQACEVIMWPEGQSDIQNFHLNEGDVRFFFGGRGRGLRNDQTREYRNVTVEFLNTKVTTYGYQSHSGGWDYGDSVLRSPVDPRAKFTDTIQLGAAAATDVQLLPGDLLPALEKEALIIPITDIDLKAEGDYRIRNAPGEVAWIPAGRKSKLVNNGTEPARFVVVEVR